MKSTFVVVVVGSRRPHHDMKRLKLQAILPHGKNAFYPLGIVIQKINFVVEGEGGFERGERMICGGDVEGGL